MSYLPWDDLRNPVLSLPHWSAKDACVIEHGGVFHIFTSLFDERRSTIAHLTTRDFRHWSDLLHHWTGDEQSAVGVCSPDIVCADGLFVLGYNTWGQPQEPNNRLFVRTSADLVTWSDPLPIAPDLTCGRRCIDLALARAEGRWMAAWKEGSTPRLATAERLDSPWAFCDDGAVRLRRSDGLTPEGIIHENFQFLAIDGIWHLLSTDYNPHEPWLYRLAGDPRDPAAWGAWTAGRRLLVPTQDFNSLPADLDCVRAGDTGRPTHPCWDVPLRVHIVDGHANAPFLLDRRSADGFFYLLYAGKNEIGRKEFNGTAAGGQAGFHRGWPRGWNRLALARSRDLVTWQAAG